MFYRGDMLTSEKKDKTILILTAQFGAGHVSAANAIKDYLNEDSNNYNIVIQNFINASIPRINKPMVKMYENNTKYIPELYNYYYYWKKSFSSKNDISHRLYTPKLSEYILKLKPDLIISTFPLAACCVYNFNLKNNHIPCITVITDVVDSCEWIYPNTDMYFLPTREIKNRLVRRGISPNSLKVTGVPINKSFYVEEKTHIEGKYRLLLLGGGRGLFDFDENFMHWIDNFIEKYNDIFEVTIVCGKNKKLYENLTNKNPVKNLKVLGFVNNMHELIKEYDLMLTKPGGATLFEAIQSKTPVIVKLPKVGQEIENAKFIVDKGIGIVYNDENDLKQIFKSITSNKFNTLVDFMSDNISDFKKTIYPENISEYINELLIKK